MTDLDAASILFPNDVPKAPAAPPEWYSVQRTAAENRLMGNHGSEAKPAAPAGEQGDDPAAMLFKDDAARKGIDYERVVGNELDQVTLDAIKDDDQERVGALRAATAALTDEFRSSGAPPEEVAEAFQILRDRPMTEPTPEEREEHFQWAVAALQHDGVSDAELNAARAMIRDYEQIAPGTIASLEAYGAGNDPKLIKLVIAQAKRRGYLR